MIDLDSNATTRMLPEVLESMLPWLADGYANPSGSYRAAKQARKAIDQAREQVAALIGAHPDEIIFTSGGTESVNSALASLDAHAGPGAAVTTAIEHSAVLRFCETLGRETRLAPVGPDGRVITDCVAPLLDGAAFLSVMAANNETGIIQPLQPLATLAHQRGIPVHTDAIQFIGKLPFDVGSAGVDMASLSAHKFHGPKGIGALFVKRGLKFQPMLHGGGQQAGRRSGTENTAAIVGMGTAAEAARQRLQQHPQPPTATLRDTFEKQVLASIAGVTVNGDPAYRLPNTCHLSFDACEAAGLLILLDEADIQCSAASACMTGKQKPSHVQLAMGIPETRAKSSLRFSFSTLNTIEEARIAADALKRAVEKLRDIQAPGVGPVVIYTP